MLPRNLWAFPATNAAARTQRIKSNRRRHRQQINRKFDERSNLGSPQLARWVECIEREKLAGPVREQFNHPALSKQISGAELHDLRDADTGLASAQHGADV